MRKVSSIGDRFWSKVLKTDTCWLWQGNKDPGGYGHFRRGRRGQGQVLAHRMAWELINGQAPNAWILHKCDVPACVNPDHLYEGNPKENAADRENRGRSKHLTGELNGGAKLTAEQVEIIKHLRATGDYTQLALGKMFEVDRSNISLITRNLRWQKQNRESKSRSRGLSAKTPRQ